MRSWSFRNKGKNDKIPGIMKSILKNFVLEPTPLILKIKKIMRVARSIAMEITSHANKLLQMT